MVPDGLQIGKSNENTSVFIDFQGIQVGPGGWPRREAPPKGGGKMLLLRPVTSNQFAEARIKNTTYSIQDTGVKGYKDSNARIKDI